MPAYVIIIEIKYAINITCLNHFKTIPNTVHRKMIFHETGPWCQKGDHRIKGFQVVKLICVDTPCGFCLCLYQLRIPLEQVIHISIFPNYYLAMYETAKYVFVD